MPRKAEVITRTLAPEAADESRETKLHIPVPQLNEFPPKFKVTYEWFTAAKASEWLREADSHQDFRQRPTTLAGVRRWKNLVITERFVHFLPNTPICVDPDGVMLNGKHRLTGLAGCPEDTKAGFMVISNVPRWMFAFFDTNKNRTLKDVFHIGNRRQGPHTPSAMKLAIRYEEFLLGLRGAGGWRHWTLVKDEHQDVDQFFARRDELQDWHSTGEKIYKTARLLAPAVMVFRFYQSLAWPDGDEKMQEFTNQLAEPPGRLPTNHPVRQLREWSRDIYMNHDQVFAKRETHLMLLFKTFAQVQNSSRPGSLNWAYGMPMAMPFHPKGHDTAVKNVRLALDEIDREFA